jgi:hypothetical protein
MTGKPTFEWSSQANVIGPDGTSRSAWILNTYAVRADFPDGTSRTRLLAPDERERHPDGEADPVFAAEVQERLGTQDQTIVIESI